MSERERRERPRYRCCYHCRHNKEMVSHTDPCRAACQQGRTFAE